MKWDWKEWVDSWLKPWHLKYRIIELKEYNEMRSEMQTTYSIEARIKFTWFWFRLSNREYTYFSKAYTEMKSLRGYPKSRKRVIPESECILLLMGEEDE